LITVSAGALLDAVAIQLTTVSAGAFLAFWILIRRIKASTTEADSLMGVTITEADITEVGIMMAGFREADIIAEAMIAGDLVVAVIAEAGMEATKPLHPETATVAQC
jgi:hypothetical protein